MEYKKIILFILLISVILISGCGLNKTYNYEVKSEEECLQKCNEQQPKMFCGNVESTFIENKCRCKFLNCVPFTE
jgi:hypothetical protein